MWQCTVFWAVKESQCWADRVKVFGSAHAQCFGQLKSHCVGQLKCLAVHSVLGS